MEIAVVLYTKLREKIVNHFVRQLLREGLTLTSILVWIHGPMTLA